MSGPSIWSWAVRHCQCLKWSTSCPDTFQLQLQAKSPCCITSGVCAASHAKAAVGSLCLHNGLLGCLMSLPGLAAITEHTVLHYVPSFDLETHTTMSYALTTCTLSVSQLARAPVICQGSSPALHADWDRTIAALQKELAIARARMEASASHGRARDLEFGALNEQLENARTAVDHLQAQNFRILEQLEQLEQASALAGLEGTWAAGLQQTRPASAAAHAPGRPRGVGQPSLIMQLETDGLLQCLHAGSCCLWHDSALLLQGSGLRVGACSCLDCGHAE